MRITVDLLRSSHPGPTVAVSLVAVLLSIGAGVDVAGIIAVGILVLANQLSVGISNDLLDAARDREARRTDKPIAAGRVSPRVAWTVAVTLAIVSLLVAGFVSVGTLAADAVLLIAGWSYNAWLKRTPFSLVAYLVGFAALPAIATYADDLPPATWATVVASLLGGAAHFANVLRDLDADRESGVRGLPQLLGRAASAIVCCAVLAIAAVAIAIGLEGSVAGYLVAAVTVLLAVGGLIADRAGASGRWLFRVVMVIAVIDVVVLVLSGSRLMA